MPAGSSRVVNLESAEPAPFDVKGLGTNRLAVYGTVGYRDKIVGQWTYDEWCFVTDKSAKSTASGIELTRCAARQPAVVW
jgi:hypothetical protein